MTCDISPTAGFLAAATMEAMNTAFKEPEIAQAAGAILIDFASFRPSSRTLDVHGHEIVLTQQHVSLTVQYAPLAEPVKQGVLSIFTGLPEFENLPAAWHHRI